MAKNAGRIGVNIASYFPIGAFQPTKALKAAEEAGYAFCQAMPLRALKKMDKPALLLLFRSKLRYVEESWNYAGSLSQVVHDRLVKKLDTPTIIDWAFFPSRSHSREAFTRLTHLYRAPNTPDPETPHVIRRTFDTQERGDLIEIHPDMDLDLDKVRRLAELHHEVNPRPLVIDLWHLRRPKGGGRIGAGILAPGQVTTKNPLGPWQESLPRLLPYTRVIHVSPRRDINELESCLNFEKTELEEMLKLINEHQYTGDFVVEAVPFGSLLDKLSFERHARNLLAFHMWLERRT